MSIVGVIDGIPVYWASKDAAPINLNLNGGTGGQARGINSLGQIVGVIDNIPAFWSSPTAQPTFLNYTSIGGLNGIAYGINNLGLIVGRVTTIIDQDTGIIIPVYWTSPTAQPTPLNLNGGTEGAAFGINSLGQIVGYIVYDNIITSSVITPVYWSSKDAVPTSLIFTTGGNIYGDANGINSLGQIVGSISNNTDRTPVYWSSKDAVPTFLNFTGGVDGINSLGQIVGYIIYNDIDTPVYLASSASQPSPLNLGGGTLGGATGISDPADAISNICFPAGTPVQTDQGVVNIERLDKNVHTLKGQPILYVTKTTTLDNYLIRFEQNALGRNVPTAKTIMTKEHKILFKGRLVPAYRFLAFSKQVKKVKYTGETLYNVLLPEYGTLHVNNLECETLHPENIIAKLYASNYTEVEKATLVYQMNMSLTTRDVGGYKAAVNRLTQQ